MPEIPLSSTAPAPRTIRVVVADDHPIVRRGIMTELAQHTDMEVAGEAVNGYEVLLQIQTRQVDVLVLDINMPGLRPTQVLRQFTTLQSPPQVLVLTAHNDPEHIIALLKAGAKGYALKEEPPDAIIGAVRAVARGETWLSASVMACLVSHSVQQPEDDLPRLSERETEVLEQLVHGKDNQEIGDALSISERTVRFHLRNIYIKLGIQRRGEAIAWGLREYMPGKHRKWDRGSAEICAK
jgi:DNA-binding NarL/FixJ family response regulator